MSVVTFGLGSAPATAGWGWGAPADDLPSLSDLTPYIEEALVLAPVVEAALGEPESALKSMELTPAQAAAREALEAAVEALELAPDALGELELEQPDLDARVVEAALEAAGEAAAEMVAKELAPDQDTSGAERPENVESLHVTPDQEEGD
jgi:hypothetical protein